MAEETGLRQVVETYGDMVYRLALAQTHSSHDADDVFQEVFLRYLRAAPDFREEEHRKAWLLRVTVNCCKKLHTSFWRRHTTALSESIPARTEEAAGEPAGEIPGGTPPLLLRGLRHRGDRGHFGPQPQHRPQSAGSGAGVAA